MPTSENVIQPIDFRQGIDLLGRIGLIEFAVESSMSGDNGPLTSTPSSRRNMAIILRDVARSLDEIANTIDPLSDESDNRVAFALDPNISAIRYDVDFLMGIHQMLEMHGLDPLGPVLSRLRDFIAESNPEAATSCLGQGGTSLKQLARIILDHRKSLQSQN